jgi:hypothetical protein
MIHENDEPRIWVFVGEGGRFPGGIFDSRPRAEEWIRKHRLTGVLTQYPLNTGAYDWAIESGFFTPRKDEHRTAEFIGGFSSASQEHFHYEDGVALE